MEKKKYTSLKEIKLELQTLDLQRQIELEELKLTKHQFKQDLSPINWIGTLLKVAKKYSTMLFLKKILK